ncbi:hypothetical protein [Clostridium oceanicum]|uniref:Mg2+ and Co2+ transporter CorB n=1 Tax=Clostridium oceanicum TaxID=1543 RepID=A0ABP3UZE7_9CLOT
MGNSKKKYKKNASNKSNTKWIFTIIIWSMIFCGSISFISDMLLKRVDLLVAFIILIFIVFAGIISDIIGVAVTVAKETPFHAMASNKIQEAKIAVRLIRNAEKVSSVCNDVVGDICGIVSGSIGILISSKVSNIVDVNITIITTMIGVLIGALTIGGKALGKGYAINNSNIIVRKVSKAIHFVKKGRC